MTRMLFVGGRVHGQWLDVDPKLHDVVLPVPDDVWSSNYDMPPVRATYPPQRYVVRQLVLMDAHLCVRGATLTRVYRVAMLDGMPHDELPDPWVVRELASGPHLEERRTGRLQYGQVPMWWLQP